MAYRRRYKRRSRRTYKKKKQGGMSISDMAVAGFQMAKKIARLVNVEKKHYTTNSIVQKNYDGTIVDLCDPLQGHDQDERTGDSIKPLHLTIRGQVYGDDTGSNNQIIRVIIFRYKDENSATLTADDVLDPALTGTSSIVFANKHWDKKFHSKILYDKMFTLGYSLTTTGNVNANIPTIRAFKFSTKLYGHINWSDSTSSQEGGGLYMLVCSNQALDANSPGLQYVARVTYTDN